VNVGPALRRGRRLALWTDESGQDLVEYVLLLIIVATIVGIAILAFGTEVSSLFSTAAKGIQAS
jgi:Flp pilus assembly pilin Flp